MSDAPHSAEQAARAVEAPSRSRRSAGRVAAARCVTSAGRRRPTACPSPDPRAASGPSTCRCSARRDGRDRGAVAEVRRRCSRCGRSPSSRGAPRGDVGVRGAVEAVAAHAGVPLARDGVACRRARGSVRVERGVEDGHVRDVGNARRATSMPTALTGLCSGASDTQVADRGRARASLISTGARERARRRARRDGRRRPARRAAAPRPATTSPARRRGR